MMNDTFDARRLIALRRTTRAVADVARSHLLNVLDTLKPLFRPRSVLGDHVASSSKQSVKGADKAFHRLQEMYDRVATIHPFSCQRGLAGPIELDEPDLELSPTQYRHIAHGDQGEKTIVVIAPLRWRLTYRGFGTNDLQKLILEKDPPADLLRSCLLHHLVMRVVLDAQPGLTSILDALHFPVESQTLPGLGELPITCIGLRVPTILPPDPVLVESTELSGTDTFEEIVEPNQIERLRDSFRDRIVELLRADTEKIG